MIWAASRSATCATRSSATTPFTVSISIARHDGRDHVIHATPDRRRQMNGRILEFNIQKSSGTISGDDGQRYAFSAADWKSDVSPRAGITVDFVTAEDGSAREIYASPDDTADIRNMSGSMKKSIIAIVCAVLAFFIPVVGIVLSIVGLVLGRQARI